MAVEYGGGGGDEDGRNGTGEGDNLQGNSALSVVKCDQELGGDVGHDKSNRGITSLVSHMDCRDDGAGKTIG